MMKPCTMELALPWLRQACVQSRANLYDFVVDKLAPGLVIEYFSFTPWVPFSLCPIVIHSYMTGARGSLRSTRGLGPTMTARGLGPTMTARGQSISISIGMLPQTVIMSRLYQLSHLAQEFSCFIINKKSFLFVDNGFFNRNNTLVKHG
jgi:hypothetical protein